MIKQKTPPKEGVFNYYLNLLFSGSSHSHVKTFKC
jgi:hypothetical protein